MTRISVERVVEESDGRILCNHPSRYGEITQEVYHRIWERIRGGAVVRIGVVSQANVCQLKRDGRLISNTNGRGTAWPIKVIWVCGEA